MLASIAKYTAAAQAATAQDQNCLSHARPVSPPSHALRRSVEAPQKARM